MSFEIFTDSASNLTEEIVKANNIHIVSYSCTINEKEELCYKEGRSDVDFARKFYNSMREKAKVKTSLINTAKLIETFEPFLKNGNDILFIGMSAGLTGTMQSAFSACEELSVKYPDCKCIAVDSKAASLGEGLQVLKAAQMRSEGKSIEECANYIEENRLKMASIFTVDDLSYLKTGGRISDLSYFVGTLLNIKPILKATNEGKIAFSHKVRGRKNALNALAESFISKAINPENQVVGIAHADCESDALYIKEKILAHTKIKDIIIKYYDICTGVHVGPGTVALFFLATER